MLQLQTCIAVTLMRMRANKFYAMRAGCAFKADKEGNIHAVIGKIGNAFSAPVFVLLY
jgi:hypothetical protein